MRKKLFLTVVSVLFIFVVSLVNPVNAETVTVNEAEIETLTGGTIAKDEDKKEVTITLTSEEINNLVWYEKDAPTYDDDVERPGNGWWIGFKLKLPSSVTPDEVTSDITNIYGASDTKKFNPDNDTEDVCSYWTGIDENKLSGKTEVFTLATYKFHWDNQKTDDLIVKINVNPENVKLTKDPSKMVTVKINDTIFTILKDKNLTTDEENGGLTILEAEKLEKLMTPEEGYKFIGLFNKENNEKFDLETKISEDLELEVRFEKIEEQKTEDPKNDNDKPNEEIKTDDEKTNDEKTEEPKVEEPKAEEPVAQMVATPSKKDNTPKTGLNDIELFVLTISILSLAGILIYNKNKE